MTYPPWNRYEDPATLTPYPAKDPPLWVLERMGQRETSVRLANQALEAQIKELERQLSDSTENIMRLEAILYKLFADDEGHFPIKRKLNSPTEYLATYTGIETSMCPELFEWIHARKAD